MRSLHPYALTHLAALALVAAYPSAARPPSRPPAPPAQGAVVAADGKPVPNASVYAAGRTDFERGISATTTTDAAGRFRLSNGPYAGDALIVAPPSGGLTFAALSGGRPIRLQPSTELRAQFTDGEGQPLRGRKVAVFPASDVAPVDGTVADIGFPRLPAPLARWMTGTTDACGALTLPGLPQRARISLTIAVPLAVGERDTELPAVMHGSALLSEGPVSDTGPIRLALDGSITGRVTYRRTGKPAPGIPAMLVGPGYHNFLGTTETDANGRYHFTGLFPATYQVMLALPPRLLAEGQRDRLPYLALPRSRKGGWQRPGLVPSVVIPAARIAALAERSARQVEGVDFALVKSAGLQVRVLGADGRPVLAAEVWSEPAGTGIVTGMDGAARLTVPPGPTRVFWTRSRIERKPQQEQQVTLAEGEKRTVVFSRGPVPPRPKRALAPEFTAEGADGKSVRLSDFRGKVVLLDFWFPEEGKNPMTEALRHTQAAMERLPRSRVVALAVDTVGQKEPFDRWLAAHPELNRIRFARDASDQRRTGEGVVQTRYGVYSWPVRYLVLPDGTIGDGFYGPAINDEGLLERAVRKVLGRTG